MCHNIPLEIEISSPEPATAIFTSDFTLNEVKGTIEKFDLDDNVFNPAFCVFLIFVVADDSESVSTRLTKPYPVRTAIGPLRQCNLTVRLASYGTRIPGNSFSSFTSNSPIYEVYEPQEGYEGCSQGVFLGVLYLYKQCSSRTSWSQTEPSIYSFHPFSLPVNTSQHALATAYKSNGQVKEAVTLLEEVVRIRGQTLAEDHPSRLAEIDGEGGS